MPGEQRPLILCEYAHAMGNSFGGFAKYWQAFRQYPRLQGGFVWDWVGQSLIKYDDNGKAVYTAAGQQASAGVPFSVQVDILDLNIRTGAGTNYAKTGETTGKGVFTIVEVKAGQGASVGWGRLKSGAGWISLDYATRLA